MESELALSFSNMSSAYITQYRSSSKLSTENWWLGYCNNQANHNLCIRFTPSVNLSSAVITLTASSYTQLGKKPCYYYLRTESGHPGVSAINSNGTSFTFTDKVASITLNQPFAIGTTYYLWLSATSGDANFAAYIPTKGIACVSEAASYTVSYDANGGTGAPDAQSKTHGTALTLSSIQPTKSATTASGYTVTFNGNGGTPSVTSATATDTTTYTFSSWNTAADGSGTSYSSGGSYTADASATLYAQYTGSAAKGSVTTPAATQIERAGFSLLGFAANSSAATAAYAPGESFTPASDVTLYAVWQAEGLVYIDLGNGFEPYQVCIDNGSGWDQYAPHIDNGSAFVLYS